MSDRGMKKWAPYASLIEQKGTLSSMKKSRESVKKPTLSQEQAEAMNRTLLHAHRRLISLTYIDQGERIILKGVVDKIHYEERWLLVDEQKIPFSKLVDCHLL